jgi:hypothetical protein
MYLIALAGEGLATWEAADCALTSRPLVRGGGTGL